jgi:hypothetical protein
MRSLVTLLFSVLLTTWLPAFVHAQTSVGAIYGGSVDATIPPCTTFGFSIDSTQTLPAGQNNARMVRVDRSGTSTTGYVLTSQVGGYTVYAFNFKSMVTLGSTVNTITGYVDAGRLQGDVGSDGKLYVFNLITTANGGCPVNQCLLMSRWSGTTLEASAIDTTASDGNIDDARESSNNFLVVAGDNGTSLREFRTYSKSTLTLQATGTVTASSSFGHIARTIDGTMYAGLATTANPNVWTFPVDSPTATQTTQLVLGAGRLVGALFPIATAISNLYAFDSDSTTALNPVRAWITTPGVGISGPTLFSGGAADSFASFQSAFYDSLEQRVFSLRTDGVQAGLLQRTTPGVTPFATQENFACGVQCNNSGSGNTGTQVSDYAQSTARFFVGSNESPARLTRIKVCATGGPPS